MTSAAGATMNARNANLLRITLYNGVNQMSMAERNRAIKRTLELSLRTRQGSRARRARNGIWYVDVDIDWTPLDVDQSATMKAHCKALLRAAEIDLGRTYTDDTCQYDSTCVTLDSINAGNSGQCGCLMVRLRCWWNGMTRNGRLWGVREMAHFTVSCESGPVISRHTKIVGAMKSARALSTERAPNYQRISWQKTS